METGLIAAGLLGNGDLDFLRNEPNHGHLDFPGSGGKIKRIPAVFVGVGDHFGLSLGGRDLGSGDGLVGGADHAGLLGG